MTSLNEIEKDEVALALTRPILVWGVEKRIAFTTLIVNSILCLHLHSLWPGVLGVIIHSMAKTCCQKEPYFFHMRFQRLLKTPPLPHYHFWGYTNSYDVF